MLEQDYTCIHYDVNAWEGKAYQCETASAAECSCMLVKMLPCLQQDNLPAP
jgi:hypothetical protein